MTITFVRMVSRLSTPARDTGVTPIRRGSGPGSPGQPGGINPGDGADQPGPDPFGDADPHVG